MGSTCSAKFAPVRVNSSLTSLFPSRRELNRKMKCGVTSTENQPMHWTFFLNVSKRTNYVATDLLLQTF